MLIHECHDGSVWRTWRLWWMGCLHERWFLVLEESTSVKSIPSSLNPCSRCFLPRRYFKKFEQYAPDSRYPQVDAGFRGKEGPVRIGYFNTITTSAKAFINSCIEIGIPYTPDFNGPNGTMGVSRVSMLSQHSVLKSLIVSILDEQVHPCLLWF